MMQFFRFIRLWADKMVPSRHTRKMVPEERTVAQANKLLWSMDSPTLSKDAIRFVDRIKDQPYSETARNAVIANLASHGAIAIELLDAFEQHHGRIDYTNVFFSPTERHQAMALCRWLITKKNYTVHNVLCSLIGFWGVETEADFQYLCTNLGDLAPSGEEVCNELVPIDDSRYRGLAPVGQESVRCALRVAAVELARDVMARASANDIAARNLDQDYYLAVLLERVGGSVPAKQIELIVAKRNHFGN